MYRFLIAITGACLLLLNSCGGGTGTSQLPVQQDDQTALGALQADSSALPQFPEDQLQPGESLDADGFVIPQRNAVASALSLNDEFQAGRDFFDDSGLVGKDAAAATLLAGANQTAWTMHRFPMGGSEPGVLSVDANLQPGMQYYAAAANFSTGRWDWSGPFSDSHVRILLDPQSSHLSGLGNAWVAVLAFDGSEIDLVSLALAQRAIGDTDAPGEVSGIGGPITGSSIDLSWDPVADGDLAGYAIYYSKNSFSSPDAAGVMNIGYLEGTTRHLLTLPPDVYYIRVAAVDINGNHGPFASGIITADIQDDTVQQISVTPSTTLLPVGSELSITVSGAELYDVDFDGDGVFEVTGSSDTEYKMEMDSAGVLRTRVHGYDAGGTYTALSGLSVLINIGNLPPFADINASSNNVAVGQVVNFDAGSSIDLDGLVAKYEWDFEGDDVYDLDSGTDPSASWAYDKAGHYAARIRVTDDDGDRTVASIGVTVRGMNFFPIAESGGSSNIELATVNGNPSIAFINQLNSTPYFLRADDSAGESWDIPVVVYNTTLVTFSLSMAVVNGNPAIAFYDFGNLRGKFVRATDANGSAWGTPVEYNPGFDTGGINDLAVINGNPAILHRGPNTMLYTRASNANGTAWNATVTVDNTVGTGLQPVLLNTVERPTAVFIRTSDVPASWRSCDGDDADGTTWGSVNQGGDVDATNSYKLNAIDIPTGSLAASYVNVNNGFELRTRYMRNVHINQWVNSRVVAKVESYGEVKLGMAGGLPFLVYHEDTNHARLIFVPALDGYGNAWGDPVILTSYDAAAPIVLAVGEADGRPVVAWQNNTENFINFGIIYN